MSTSALVSIGAQAVVTPRAQRFETQADEFIRNVMPAGTTLDRAEQLSYVPGFRFSAVLRRRSRLWIISYISGSNLTYFRKNVNDAAKSFAHAWSSPLGQIVERTIPMLNNEAPGYDPTKLDWQIRDLQKDARGNLVRWTEKDQLVPLLADG